MMTIRLTALFVALVVYAATAESRGAGPSPEFTEYIATHPWATLCGILLGDERYEQAKLNLPDSLRSAANALQGDMRRCTLHPFDTTTGTADANAINAGNNRLFRAMIGLYGKNDSDDIVAMLKACPFDMLDENPNRSLSTIAAWATDHPHSALLAFAWLRMAHCYAVILDGLSPSSGQRPELLAKQMILLNKLSRSENSLLSNIGEYLQNPGTFEPRRQTPVQP